MSLLSIICSHLQGKHLSNPYEIVMYRIPRENFIFFHSDIVTVINDHSLSVSRLVSFYFPTLPEVSVKSCRPQFASYTKDRLKAL